MAIETLQYVYQISDFDTTGGNIAPPNEQGARAAGNPPFNLQLNAGAAPQQIQVNDTDNDGFDEINSGGQTLNAPITLDGVTYPAGTPILVNYVLETATGVRVYSITIGANNTGNNTTTALISEQPLVPGQQYVFTSEGNIGNGEVDYALLACFTEGTMIETDRGPRAIETLRMGDLVLTLDHALRPICWIGSTTVPATGDHAPVVFSDGAIGNCGELCVSPNHRMVMRGPQVELMTGAEEVLVIAKHLVNGRTVTRRDGGYVTYFHLLFEDHEIVVSNGVPSESFFPKTALDQMDSAQRSEILSLFPCLESRGTARLARPSLKRHEALVLS
ncbi:hypothetical protein DEA8626_02272 [Defluviimonas aquaemixtae]|uniref:Hedgehog/Intein (Hint) domain-containing protein n=1 Tax=Albidovulum aquaemixtae TaxID=1542388 RepID=A0A2R8B7Y3_9RHOB|nr:Hint domain-containing protein [Defluviimonas aquaemixtae]SPH18730.1 hypothetical protein DEA8626_02272 [Defluviimonas aquaemixtae]